MSNPIVYVIQDFAVAQHVRADLLAAGLPHDSVALSPIADEAGPGQANFTVGDAPSVKGGTDYNDVYRPQGDGDRGACILRVLAEDAYQEDLARAVLERYRTQRTHALSEQRVP